MGFKFYIYINIAFMSYAAFVQAQNLGLNT